MAFNSPIVMKTTATEDYCVDKLYTQAYQNLARNVQTPALYLLMTLSTVQFTMQRFKCHPQLHDSIVCRHLVLSVIETG